MKKIIFAAIMLAGAVALAACDSEEPVVDEILQGGLVSPNVTPRPTDWIAREDLNPTTAQPVVVTREGLPADITDDDLLAAFIGGQCYAVSGPITDDTDTYFTLIVMTSDDTEGSPQVELRYYSAVEHRIYVADPFVQSPGKRLGSLTEGGYAPCWR